MSRQRCRDRTSVVVTMRRELVSGNEMLNAGVDFETAAHTGRSDRFDRFSYNRRDLRSYVGRPPSPELLVEVLLVFLVFPVATLEFVQPGVDGRHLVEIGVARVACEFQLTDGRHPLALQRVLLG